MIHAIPLSLSALADLRRGRRVLVPPPGVPVRPQDLVRVVGADDRPLVVQVVSVTRSGWLALQGVGHGTFEDAIAVLILGRAIADKTRGERRSVVVRAGQRTGKTAALRDEAIRWAAAEAMVQDWKAEDHGLPAPRLILGQSLTTEMESGSRTLAEKVRQGLDRRSM